MVYSDQMLSSLNICRKKAAATSRQKSSSKEQGVLDSLSGAGDAAHADSAEAEEPAKGRKTPPQDAGLSFVPTGAGTSAGKGVYYLVQLLLCRIGMLFLNGPTPDSFCLFSFFSNTNFTYISCRLKRDSNLDRQSRMRARWPLDHGPIGMLFQACDQCDQMVHLLLLLEGIYWSDIRCLITFIDSALIKKTVNTCVQQKLPTTGYKPGPLCLKSETAVYSDRQSIHYPPVSDAFANKEFFSLHNTNNSTLTFIDE